MISLGGIKMSIDEIRERETEVNGYEGAYSIDEFVNQKHKFVGKNVKIQGQLSLYEMGDGILNLHLKVQLKGDKWRINLHNEVSRIQGEHKILQPYFDSFMGKTIGALIFADSCKIKELYFEDKPFKFIS